MELQTVEVQFCDEHKSSDLKFYCESCKKLICVQCTTTEQHKGHEYKLVSDVFSKHCSEIKESIKPVNDQLVLVKKAISRLELLTNEMSEKRGVIEAGISDVIGLIMSVLQTRKEELKKQLDLAVDEKLASFDLQKKRFNVIRAQLSSCVGFVRESLRTCSKEEILMMKTTILRQADLLLTECRKYPLHAGDGVNIKLSASPTSIMERCSEFGKIIVSDVPVENARVHAKLSTHQRLHMTPSVPLETAKILARRLGPPVLTLSGVKGPCGVAIGNKGEVIIAEACGDCVSVFSPEGKKLKSFGAGGSDKGEFSCPCEVDIDDSGNILVVDGSNRRIQKFTPEGQFLAEVGSKGQSTLQFTEPDGIAVNPLNKKIYVVDNNTNRVQILNPDLSFCSVFGKEGKGGGYLRYPWGVACDTNGEVYVTDSGNCCVQVFTADGQFLREFGKKGSGAGGQLLWPTGISVSESGLVFVSDYGNHRVCVFTVDGEYLRSVGGRAHSDGCGDHLTGLGKVRGIKVDRSGLVYVCDTDNNRVVLF